MTPANRLPRSAPEAQGISSSTILKFVDEVEKNIHELHSFMLLRHGVVVAEGWWGPYAPDRPHMLFSLSKSFTSTAVGLAVTEGRLTVEDRVLSFFPKYTPAEVSKNLAAMQVHHLLSMSTGHAQDTMEHLTMAPDGNWVKAFLELPVEYEPGTHFLYNTGATYMLSAIVQKLTGMKLLDYLMPRLFTPLSIKGATWETSPQGINMGGFGLSIKTEDIACFGQLYLQKGMWKGQCILPEDWVKTATSRQIKNGRKRKSDWEQGYGYQFWRCRHHAYRGDGAFGQYCVVMPEQDAVLAITSGLGDMQPPLDIVWDVLLPGMGPEPLPGDEQAEGTLALKLKSLALAPQAARTAGQKYRVDANELEVEWLAFDFSEDACNLKVGEAGREHQVTCGFGTWKEVQTTLFIPDSVVAPRPFTAASCASWTTAGTLVLTIRLVETPFIYTLTCHFSDGQVKLLLAPNVSLGPVKIFELVGRL